MIFESHAHLDDKRFDEDRDLVINSLKEYNIDKVINIGADMRSSKNTYDLTTKYDFIYGAVGIHPHAAKEVKEDDMEILKEYTKNPKIVAIGEIGLDFYYDYSDRDAQRFWFKRQLQLANELEKPVIIHSRDASEECYEIVTKSKISKGVVHCFSGSVEMAKKYINLGLLIGIGGVITFKNAKKLLEVVDSIPIESILLETDCPYLSPEPYRGKRNSPIYLPAIVKKVSEIKQISVEEVEKITYCNTMSLFGLK